jgi:hypothetical protein
MLAHSISHTTPITQTQHGNHHVSPDRAANSTHPKGFEISIRLNFRVPNTSLNGVDDMCRQKAIAPPGSPGKPRLPIPTLRNPSTTTRPSRDPTPNKSTWPEPHRLENARVQILHALTPLDQRPRMRRRDRSARLSSARPAHRTASVDVDVLQGSEGGVFPGTRRGAGTHCACPAGVDGV